MRAFGDQVVFAYEADTWPWLGGFETFNACDLDCTHSLEDGNYVAHMQNGGGNGIYNYSRLITTTGGTPPPTLWVEWRFRSNYSYLQSNGFVLDDARVRTQYDQTVVSVSTWMWGDAAFDAGVGPGCTCSVTGMPMGEFHTYRFEIANGLDSLRWADGKLLQATTACCPSDGTTFIQFGGNGGGLGGGPNGMGYPGLEDTWDYVRYGLITYGETVTAADPPFGYIDPRQDRASNVNTPQGLMRLTVTFNEPNGLNISNITVQSTAPAALWPIVEWVTRPDGDLGTTWEIRLNQRIPPGHRTRFIISDEADAAAVGQVGVSSVVEYGFLPADVNGDSVANTQDLLAWIQAVNAGTADVLHHDINRDEAINTLDLLRTVHLLNGLNTLQAWNGVSLPNWP
jgi:hypothetical protein